MNDRHESPFQPSWIFALIVLFWIIAVALHAGLPYIVGSGAVGLGAWFLLYLTDRDERTARREIARLQALTDRSNARVAELETELGIPRTGKAV
jgi:lauroyl/myristoyl acyltransferase